MESPFPSILLRDDRQTHSGYEVLDQTRLQDICESPAEYGIADLANEFGKIVDIIEEDVNAKFEMTIPRGLIDNYLKEND